jgi:hypothetical protein
MRACTTVGAVWPAFRVPGMMRSGTILEARNSAVVVANDPMPSVSRKFVIAPTPICNGVGKRASVAGSVCGAPGWVRRAAATARAQSPTNATLKATSAASNAVIGFMRVRSPGSTVRDVEPRPLGSPRSERIAYRDSRFPCSSAVRCQGAIVPTAPAERDDDTTTPRKHL